MNNVETHANLFGLSNLPGIYLRGSTLPSYFFIETPTCFLLNLPYMESSWIITATIFLPFVRRTGFYWQGETNSVHSSGIAGILYCCSLQCIWIITLRYTFFLGLCGVCVDVWCACVWVFTDVYQSDNFESFETGSVYVSLLEKAERANQVNVPRDQHPLLHLFCYSVGIPFSGKYWYWWIIWHCHDYWNMNLMVVRCEEIILLNYWAVMFTLKQNDPKRIRRSLNCLT